MVSGVDTMKQNSNSHEYKSVSDFRYGLRQVIIVILFKENIALSNKEIYDKMVTFKLNFNPIIYKIETMTAKLFKLDLVEYVYNEMKYIVKLTEAGIEEYRRIRKEQF